MDSEIERIAHHLSKLSPLAELTLDWRTEGNEWQVRLRQCLSGTGIVIVGSKLDETTRPFASIRLTIGEGGEPAELMLLAAGADRTLAFATQTVGDGVRVELAAAAEEAARLVGAQGSLFTWAALLGPSNEVTEWSDASGHLPEPSEIGGMTLSPWGQLVVENRPSQFNALNAAFPFSYEPILVQGSSRGYSWNRAVVTD